MSVIPLPVRLEIRSMVTRQMGVELIYNRGLTRAEIINLWLHLRTVTPSPKLPEGWEPSDKSIGWEPAP